MKKKALFQQHELEALQLTLIRTRKEVKHLQTKKISAFEDRYVALVPMGESSNINLVVFKKHDFEQQPKAKLKKAAKKLSITYSKIKYA